MSPDLQGLLERIVDADDAALALERACDIVRDRLHASGAWVHAVTAHVLSRAGTTSARRVDAVVARALATGRSVGTPVEGLEVHDGLDTSAAPGAAVAVPLRCGGETVGALSCAWDGEPGVDRRHAELLLVAAATAVAPHAMRLADARAAAAVGDAAPDALGLLGVSAAMVALRARVLRVAAAPFHVLVDGESGSGKELVARALHAAGPRRHRRLCTVNCAALTDELLEAELFGHTRGAFTGAVRDRAGLFEEADGGTLFLDEVGELSLRAQAKLLRVLQDGEVRRVGESHARRVDARLVAATNRVLADEVEAGRFRADLRYRLEVVRIAVVPLRERPDDIAMPGARVLGRRGRPHRHPRRPPPGHAGRARPLSLARQRAGVAERHSRAGGQCAVARPGHAVGAAAVAGRRLAPRADPQPGSPRLRGAVRPRRAGARRASLDAGRPRPGGLAAGACANCSCASASRAGTTGTGVQRDVELLLPPPGAPRRPGPSRRCTALDTVSRGVHRRRVMAFSFLDDGLRDWLSPR